MDPLRPFAGLIRTLWKSNSPTAGRGEGTPNSVAAGSEQQQNETAEAIAETTLRTRLRARLMQVGLADPRRAREAFVSTILAAELGDDLERDPSFNDMVTRVADQLGADPNLGTHLQSLLHALVDNRAGT